MPDPESDQFTLPSVGVIAGVILGNAVGCLPIINGTFGVFLGPVARDIGWSMTAFSGVLLIVSIAGLVAYPYFGRIADRYGARRTALIGNVVFAFAIAGLACANQSIVTTYTLFLFAGLAGTIPSTVVLAKVISEWFERWRGVVFGFATTSGIALGFIFLPPLCQWLIDRCGWRVAYLVLAAVVLGVGQMAFWTLLRSRGARRYDAVVAAADGMSGAQARRTPIFGMIIAAACLSGAAISAVCVHLVPMSVEHGVSAQTAVLAMSTLAAANVLGQTLLGRLFDRLSTPRVAAPTALVAIGGLFVLSDAHSAGAFMFGGALTGVGAAAEYSFFPYALQRYFGRKAYGEIYGWVFGASLLSQSVGPLLLSMVRDLTGSYRPGLVSIAVILLVTAMLIARLPAYTDGAREPQNFQLMDAPNVRGADAE